MRQMNIRVDAKFEADLSELARRHRLTSRADAVRMAVQLALAAPASPPPVAVGSLRGWANQFAPAPNYRAISDDAIWESGWLP
jgi:hypothetical protein